MTTTFSLRVLLRGGTPKNADNNKLPDRPFLGLGLSSRTSIYEERPDDVEDRGGVFGCLIIYSDVGSPYPIIRGVFLTVEWV